MTCVNVAQAGIVDKVLASGEKAGYDYELQRVQYDCSGSSVPSVFFCADSSGKNWKIRFLRKPRRNALVRW
jgi:hypothetical protein